MHYSNNDDSDKLFPRRIASHIIDDAQSDMYSKKQYGTECGKMKYIILVL